MAALLELGAGFHSDLTGRENIYLNGSLLGFSKAQIDCRFDQIVAFAELEDFIDTPVKHYSSGMYVRLGFAIAVNVDPDVLLIDEVLAVGDEAFQKKCKKRMDAFKAQGKTIVIVTHDLSTVEHWCSRALWLEKGKAEVCGTAPGVVGAYRDRIMARLETSTRRRAEAPESGGKRWGDRRIEITEVQLLDEAGKARMVFTTGEAMTIVIRYKVHESIGNPVFGFALMRADGLWCFGSNTRIGGIPVCPLTCDGTIEIELNKIPLLPNSYFVDVAIETMDGVTCDYLTQSFPFEMLSSINDVGVFRQEHSWRFNGSKTLPIIKSSTQEKREESAVDG
jgi:energy-coupling factor transporter ATP-binding protein EcfA2